MEKLPDGTEDTFAVVPPAADAAELQAQAEKARAALEGLLPLLPPGLVPLSAEPVDLKCVQPSFFSPLFSRQPARAHSAFVRLVRLR